MKWILGFLFILSLQVRAESVTPAAVTPPTELAETQIPVQLEPAKKTADSDHPLFKMILSLGILAVMGGAAYVLVRKYRYSNPQSAATQIKILSQHYLGPKKSLAIVRVAGESVLIGVTDHSISMIKSLSLLDEDIPEETPKDFGSLFSKKTKMETTAEEPESKDEFAISGIRDFVSGRLRNMRSLE